MLITGIGYGGITEEGFDECAFIVFYVSRKLYVKYSYDLPSDLPERVVNSRKIPHKDAKRGLDEACKAENIGKLFQYDLCVRCFRRFEAYFGTVGRCGHLRDV